MYIDMFRNRNELDKFLERLSSLNLPDEMLEATNSEVEIFLNFTRQEEVLVKRRENYSIDESFLSLAHDSVIDELPQEEPDFMKRPYAFKSDRTPFLFLGDAREIYFQRLYTESECEILPNGSFSPLPHLTQPTARYLVNVFSDSQYRSWFCFEVDYRTGRIDVGETESVSDAKDAVYYIMTLLFLLNAERSPAERKEYIDKQTKSDKMKGKLPKHRIHISVSAEFIEKTKALGTVSVRGHLRNQAYGPEHSLRKIIFIAPYEYERELAVQNSSTNKQQK